ncbi:hypothetical protein [Thiohalocapsa halophila]|nr:hypothetical protein [Thiohalocapsa halophila]
MSKSPGRGTVDVSRVSSRSDLCESLASSLTAQESVYCSSSGTSGVTYYLDGWGRVLRGQARVEVSLCSAPAVGGVIDAAACYLLEQQGGFFLHGACFALGSASVIAVADSGAGKSSLSAAAVASGGRLISDDSLLVAPGVADERVLVYPNRADASFLPDTASLLPHSLQRLLQDGATTPTGKLVLSRLAAPGHFQACSAPTHLLLLDAQDRNEQTRVTPASQAQALSALIGASSRLAFSRLAPDSAALRTAKMLATALPAFRVRVSNGLIESPVRTLQTLLTDIRAG